MNSSGIWYFILWMHYLALALWIGGMVVVSAVVAPSVHGSMVSKALAGEIIGKVLSRLNSIELLCASILIGTLTSSIHFISTGLSVSYLLLTVGTMGLITLFYAFHLTPKMKTLREGTLNFYDLSPEHAVKKEFRRLHKLYVNLMSLNLVLGLAVLYASLRVIQ